MKGRVLKIRGAEVSIVIDGKRFSGRMGSRTAAALPVLAKLTKKNNAPDLMKRLSSLDRKYPGLASDFLQFAAALPYDWAYVEKARRQDIVAQVRAIRDAADKLGTLLLQHGSAFSFWHAHPLTTSLVEGPLSTDEAGMPPTQPFLLYALLGGAPLSEPALKMLGEILDNLSLNTHPELLPAALRVMPTKATGRTARDVFFMRALTWFMHQATGKHDDTVVALAVTELTGRFVEPDHVAKRRKELQKLLGK